MFQDNSFTPARELQHDDVLATPEFTLRAVHTPGHVSNHFCFLLEEEGMLFAGDHIMNGSTVVIIPPSGDMKAYIESLQLLLRYPLQYIAPGHGEVMQDSRGCGGLAGESSPKREGKVVSCLTQPAGRRWMPWWGWCMTTSIPACTRWRGYPCAAHLIKLRQEQRARCTMRQMTPGKWRDRAHPPAPVAAPVS